jgi:hypothetical protein
MYYRITILAHLFLRKASLSFLLSFLMTFSDALPVQFWPINCATFNEHVPAGVHKRCFLAPWQCDDEIKIQFTDDPGNSYSLLVLNEEGVTTDTIEFEEISSGLYQLSLVPSENSPGFCEEKIQLKIQSNAGFQSFALPAFNEWANAGGAGDPWTTGATPSYAVTPGGNETEFLFVDYAFIVGLEYSLALNYTSTSGTFSSQINIFVLDSSNNIIFSNSGVNVIQNGANSTVPFMFVADASSTRVGIKISPGSFDSATVTLNSITSLRQVGITTDLYKSDYLDLKIEHPDTILVNYSNHRNFAGLNYEQTSPDIDFNIRVPAIFYHQRFPEEDEVMELSSALATLNGTLRKQRLLDTDYLPYYFHEKLKLILKHQFVSILDRQWVKQEGYEIEEGERRWPLKKAKCWLSEKEFVHRNIL